MITFFILFISLILFVSTIALLTNKELFTRILFLNYISGMSVLMISALSLYSYNSSYIDIAIIYVLLSFIASFAFLHYFKFRSKNKDKHD